MNEELKYIANNLDSEKVLALIKKLGITRFIEKESCVIFPTVCHHINEDDASMKLYYYKNNCRFHCYTEDGQMTIFSFLQHFYEKRGYEYNWYKDILLPSRYCANLDNSLIDNFISFYQDKLKDRYQPKAKEIVQPEYPEYVLDSYSIFYPPEWIKDGISIKKKKKYNIRFSPIENKIIIPHYDINNRLIGIRGRALNKEEIELFGKYAPVQIEQKWYSHKLSMNLYGLNFNIDNIKKERIVYIFEGEKSCMQMESFSIPNCSVAICGSNFNKFQLYLLLKYCYPKEIIFCLDNEEKPREDKYFYKMWNLCSKYKNFCNISFIYDRKHLLNLKDSPSDHGEDVFIQLLKARTKVT